MNQTSDYILEIDSLGKSFDGLELFKDTSWLVPAGAISILMGKNGSGKTTLFNMLTGYIRPDLGTVRFNDIPITHTPPDRIARLGIGKMWQSPRTMLFMNYTVLENLLVSAHQHPGDRLLNNFFRYRAVKRYETQAIENAHRLLTELEIERYATQTAGALSLGNQKLVCLAMLLMNDSRLLLLDEPFSSVHPDTIQKISDLLLRLKQKGKSILMIEHKIQYAKQISDHIFEITDQKIEEI